MKKIIVIPFIILFILWIVIFSINCYRCLKLERPIFVLECAQDGMDTLDGSSNCTYYCLGYHVNTKENNNSDQEKQVLSTQMIIFDLCILEQDI